MNSTLAAIIIQNLEFFGLASESEIHPDGAVRQLEIIASMLNDLPRSELESFFAHVQNRSETLKNSGAPKEQVVFLKNLDDLLGIKI
jgi:hypothetical protein